MQFNRFTWLDRVGQHLNRRVLTKMDGSTETVDVTRGDDSITVDGTPFAAETMNGLEGRIAAAIDEGNNQFQQQGASIAGLETNLDEVYTGSNRANYIENRCLLDNGDIIVANGYALTPRLYLPEGEARSFTWGCTTHANVQGSGHDMALIVYDSSGAAIATYKTRSTNSIDLPSTARTIVASFYIPDAVENNIMIQVGTNAPYEFYRAKTEQLEGLISLAITAKSANETAADAYRKAASLQPEIKQVVTRVFAVTIDVAAGTIGERGAQATFDASMAGYKIIGAFISFISNSASANVMTFKSQVNDTFYVNAYRTSTSAKTITVDVTVTYIEN